MQELPTSKNFDCRICHLSTEPVQADLNSFGDAFLDNGSRWDATLASQSSDADGCTNGFELGDEDGDGELDDEALQISGARHNPGVDDCQLQIRESAWGDLKKLFRQ
jgi:hypothetical protein